MQKKNVFFSAYGLLMILSAIPVYLIFIAPKNKPTFVQKVISEYIFVIFVIKSENGFLFHFVKSIFVNFDLQFP